MAWVDIFRRRFALRQQQWLQSDSLIRLQPAVALQLGLFLCSSVAAQLLRLAVNS